MTEKTTDNAGREYLVIVRMGALPNRNPYPLQLAYKREKYEVYRAESPMAKADFRKWAADLFGKDNIIEFIEVIL